MRAHLRITKVPAVEVHTLLHVPGGVFRAEQRGGKVAGEGGRAHSAHIRSMSMQTCEKIRGKTISIPEGVRAPVGCRAVAPDGDLNPGVEELWNL